MKKNKNFLKLKKPEAEEPLFIKKAPLGKGTWIRSPLRAFGPQKKNLFFNMKGSLFLYTFDTKFLEKNIKALEDILFLFKKKNILDFKKIGLETRKKHRDLLRSPHIHKKSREQYIRIHQKFIFELDFYNTKTLFILYTHIQKRTFQGASLFFEWNTHDYLFPTKNISQFKKISPESEKPILQELNLQPTT